MTPAKRQLAFDLGVRPALGGGDFLVGDCNVEAIAWLDRWPDWPSPAVVLFGPEACGKTHLATIFAGRNNAAMLRADDLAALDPFVLFEAHRAAVIDDADRIDAEQALFHLFNAAKESRAHLLLTAEKPPARWGIALPDLRSRLSSVPAVGIAAPDDQLAAGLAVKLFADRQLRIGQDVVAYLLLRCGRSFAAIREVVERLDEAALGAQRSITVPFAREVLEGLTASEDEQG